MPGDDRFVSLDHTIRLPDGRTLGYSEYGSPTGNTLFYFGSSRLEACLLARAAANAGVRVIGTDRPGMGLSQFQPGRRLLDWPADVVALADHLGIARFAVVGVSAGGPHALACAPDGVTLAWRTRQGRARCQWASDSRTALPL